MKYDQVHCKSIKVATLLTIRHIQKFYGSNLGWDISFPEEYFGFLNFIK